MWEFFRSIWSAGVVPYLIKPFLDRELHATIKMALMRSRADEAVRENEALLFRALCTTPIVEC
jgi:DNA-binding response OmpR family regulator